MSSPAGAGRPVVTCLAGRWTRRAGRWVVARVLLPAPTGALVPLVPVDEPVGACQARAERAPGADPVRR